MRRRQVTQTDIMVFIVLSFLLNCDKPQDKTSQTPIIPVKTATVKKEKLSFPIHSSGILNSSRDMKLSFKVGGIIEEIRVDEGDQVHRDQLMATLNKAEIMAMKERAESSYQKALRDYRRVAALYEDSVATLEQKQDTETALSVAKSNLNIAEYNLKHASIVAPTDGKVLKRLAEKSEMIDSGNPVFIFGSTEGAWIIRTGIPDRDVIRIQYGDSAQVTFDVYPKEIFSATVTQIAQAADARTGTFEIELTLLNSKKNLIYGFVADIQIYPAQHEWYQVIPVEAIAEADGSLGTVFYFDSDSKQAAKTRVEIVRLYDGQVAVRSGLEDITQVITEGTAYLREGSLVRLISGDGENE
jgi:multidrug efflux system membrane fusion protein